MHRMIQYKLVPKIDKSVLNEKCQCCILAKIRKKPTKSIIRSTTIL